MAFRGLSSLASQVKEETRRGMACCLLESETLNLILFLFLPSLTPKRNVTPLKNREAVYLGQLCWVSEHCLKKHLG